jgi:hypothetical protein
MPLQAPDFLLQRAGGGTAADKRSRRQAWWLLMHEGDVHVVDAEGPHQQPTEAAVTAGGLGAGDAEATTTALNGGTDSARGALLQRHLQDLPQGSVVIHHGSGPEIGWIKNARTFRPDLVVLDSVQVGGRGSGSGSARSS